MDDIILILCSHYSLGISPIIMHTGYGWNFGRILNNRYSDEALQRNGTDSHGEVWRGVKN